MDPMTLAAVLLGLAALGGLAMAGIRLGGAPRPPTWMALGHGGVAAAGVLLLVYAALTTGLPRLGQAALVIFLIAAAGGAMLFLRYHLRRLELPLSFIAGHGALAAIGFVVLLLAVLG